MNGGSLSPNFYQLVSTRAAAEIRANLANGGAGIGNSYQMANEPGFGNSAITRLEVPVSPTQGNQVFTLVLNNTAGATVARQIIGDYVATYVLAGNAELNPAGFVIGGTFGTLSKAQVIGRTFARPWRVSSVQFIASDETLFNLTNAYYFDTPPSGNAPTKNSLTLTNLLNAGQFNPKIQVYANPMLLDGINGLDITIPAGMILTLQFTIESEGVGSAQKLLN